MLIFSLRDQRERKKKHQSNRCCFVKWKMNDALAIGTKIKARYRSLAKSNSNSDETNDIIIESSKKDDSVHKEIVKSYVPSEICIGEETKASLKVGDRVEAKYRGRGRRWYKGTIVKIQNGDLYDVDYDDGDRDRSLSEVCMKSVVVVYC